MVSQKVSVNVEGDVVGSNNNDDDHSRTRGLFVEIVIVESPTLILIKVSLNNANCTLLIRLYHFLTNLVASDGAFHATPVCQFPG